LKPTTVPAAQCLADDYFREVIRGETIDREAFDRLLKTIIEDPSTAWQVVQRLLTLATSEGELSLIGSGPVEELLVRHPTIYVERVIDEAMVNPKLRRSLNSSVISEGDIPQVLLDRLDGFRRMARSK
jgi:hypothetical protein